MNRLTVRQQKVLEALADYHYLVPAQMVRLALSKSTGAKRRSVRRFAFELPGDDGRMVKNSKAAIGAIRAGVDRESGRIARMYYLTRMGAELVAENRQTDPELIFYPRGDRLVLADIPHRRLAIDFRIELDRYAKEHGHTVEFYHQYFRTAGANRGTETGERLRKLTRIDFPAELAARYRKPFFWPDGIFVLKAGTKRTLCLVEAYRGSETGRVMQQLVWHIVALDHGLPSEKYGLQTAHRVLVVFEDEAALAAVLQRLLQWDSIDEHREFIL